MAKISPHSVIDSKACVASDCEIGPFCHIGPDVNIGAGTRLLSHVSILGHVSMGKNNVVYPNAVIGAPPQDRKYMGSPTRVEVGDDNVFREAVTIHRGTEKGGGFTRIGNNNYLMVNTHLGHDVRMGAGCTLANNVMVGGHCHVGDYVNIMGGVGINHFVTIGEFAFIGGMSRIHHDVPPFCKIDGPDIFRGLNVVGLRRAGFQDQDVEALETACRRLFYHDKPFTVAMAEFDTLNGLNAKVKQMVDFLRRRDLGRHGRYLESLRAK